jgi:hypothetical protein
MKETQAEHIANYMKFLRTPRQCTKAIYLGEFRLEIFIDKYFNGKELEINTFFVGYKSL